MFKMLDFFQVAAFISITYITTVLVEFRSTLALIPSNLPEQCRAEIQSSIDNLHRGRSINIHVEIRDAEQGHPNGRSQKVIFSFDGRDLYNLMSSPQMMTSTARSIIQNCPTVSAFQFGQLHSGWSYTIGIVNGNIQWFKCYEEEDRHIAPVWGYQHCNL